MTVIDEIAAERRLEWITIASAPKDGTEIIGARLDGWSDERFVSVIWWQPEFGAWISGARVMTLALGMQFEDGSSRQMHSPEIRKPTHWIPHPSLPKADPAEIERLDRSEQP